MLRAPHDKAKDSLTKDRAVLLAFYDFPAERLKRGANDEGAREHLLNRPLSNGKVERIPLEQDGSCHDLQARTSAETSWHRLRGHNRLPRIVMGVKLNDGIEVVDRKLKVAA